MYILYCLKPITLLTLTWLFIVDYIFFLYLLYYCITMKLFIFLYQLGGGQGAKTQTLLGAFTHCHVDKLDMDKGQSIIGLGGGLAYRRAYKRCRRVELAREGLVKSGPCRQPCLVLLLWVAPFMT